MPSDREIHTAANELLQKFGERGADRYVQERVTELAADGDMAGCVAWVRIACAVRDILAATEVAQDLIDQYGVPAADRVRSKLTVAMSEGDGRAIVRWSLVRDRLEWIERHTKVLN